MFRSASAAPQAAQGRLSRPAGGRALVARRPQQVVCMAHPRRVAKVAKQIEREVGNLLITDKVLQAAVCPERARGFDGAVSALASVTEVVISNDLQVAKVYLSIYSDDMGKATALEGLQRLEGYVRKHIGRQVRLRLTPEIRFLHDDSIERSERIYRLLEEVKRIDRGEAEPPPVAFYGEEEDEEGEDWEDDEEEDAGAFSVVDLGMFGDEENEEAAPSTSGRQAQAVAAAAATAKAAAAVAGSGAAGRQQRKAAAAPPRRQRGGSSDAEKEGGVQQADEDFEEMLAAFKSQLKTRQRQRQ